MWVTPEWELDILLAGIAGELDFDRGEGLRLYPTGGDGPRRRNRRSAGAIPMGGENEHPAWKDLPLN